MGPRNQWRHQRGRARTGHGVGRTSSSNVREQVNRKASKVALARPNALIRDPSHIHDVVYLRLHVEIGLRALRFDIIVASGFGCALPDRRPFLLSLL